MVAHQRPRSGHGGSRNSEYGCAERMSAPGSSINSRSTRSRRRSSGVKLGTSPKTMRRRSIADRYDSVSPAAIGRPGTPAGATHVFPPIWIRLAERECRANGCPPPGIATASITPVPPTSSGLYWRLAAGPSGLRVDRARRAGRSSGLPIYPQLADGGRSTASSARPAVFLVSRVIAVDPAAHRCRSAPMPASCGQTERLVHQQMRDDATTA